LEHDSDEFIVKMRDGERQWVFDEESRKPVASASG
jgi:hypothetical protein